MGVVDRVPEIKDLQRRYSSDANLIVEIGQMSPESGVKCPQNLSRPSLGISSVGTSLGITGVAVALPFQDDLQSSPCCIPT